MNATAQVAAAAAALGHGTVMGNQEVLAQPTMSKPIAGGHAHRFAICDSE
jgi:hypothetical protein